MSAFPLSRPFRSLAVAGALAALLLVPPVLAETVSAEVGVPLKAAKEALEAKRYDQALKEVDKARAVPSITAREKWAAELIRAAIHKAQGRFDLAANAFEAALGLVPMSDADTGGALETLSQLWYRAGDFPKSAAFGEKAMAAGRTSDAFRQMVAEAYFRAKQPAKSAALARRIIDDQRKAGRTPSAEVLQLQAASEFGSGDTEGYIKTLKQQLLNGDRSRENWQRLLDATSRAKPIPDRLDMDWARLKLAANAYDNPDSLTEMAQRAMVEDLPADAAAALAHGWKIGLLGTGPAVERQQRLRDYAAQQLAAQKEGLAERHRQVLAGKDANALAKLGMVYASLGDLNQAIPLLQQALTGKLISPTVVRLRLGVLQYRAGQAQAAAQTLAALPPGSDEARLAGIWGLMYGGR